MWRHPWLLGVVLFAELKYGVTIYHIYIYLSVAGIITLIYESRGWGELNGKGLRVHFGFFRLKSIFSTWEEIEDIRIFFKTMHRLNSGLMVQCMIKRASKGRETAMYILAKARRFAKGTYPFKLAAMVSAGFCLLPIRLAEITLRPPFDMKINILYSVTNELIGFFWLSQLSIIFCDAAYDPTPWKWNHRQNHPPQGYRRLFQDKAFQASG